MVESTKYNTFFDIGIQEDPTKEFAQMRCYIYGNKKKKRVINNEIVKKYFNDIELSEEEQSRLTKILDGSIYTDRRNLYDHCKLCSNDFERKDLNEYSKKYKYWSLCIPTFPYFPGGLMVYLKNREYLRIENVQDLSDSMFEELLIIEKDIYELLRNQVFGDDIVGINMLFNQLSKSELCIHGHLEPIFKNVDELDVGCTYVENRPFDQYTHIINSNIDSEQILKIPEGIKIPIFSENLGMAKGILKKYENIIRYYFDKGKKLRSKELEIKDEDDEMLYERMVPAATNFVYLTYYNDKFMLSSVPELTLDFVEMDQVTDDPGDLFALSINRNYTNRDNVFMRNYSPLVRPSIKVYNPNENNQKILTLNKKVYRGMSNDFI